MISEREKIRARVVDAQWLRQNVNCRAACPVHTNAQGYIEAIAKGDFDAAYDVARLPNPFVNICARICGHPCEFACRRGVHDEAISIRALKRAAADFSAGGMRHGGTMARQPKKNKKVAVIGGGPGGVTAAHDLSLIGYDVTLFEGSEMLGGMLYKGIPEYRLPRDVIKSEIDGLMGEGIEVRMNTLVGKDVKFADLRRDYDAIFMAVGAQKGRGLKIAGIETDGVISGIDFLLNINLGYKVDLGKKVVVIGGGNVAMDVARTAAREAGVSFGGDEYGYEVALDVARSAMRQGAAEVHLICLESAAEMPAFKEEVVETKREGVVVHNSVGPRRVVGSHAKCIGLEVVKVLSVFDENGRFSPKFDEGSENIIDCDSILLAIGQQPDLDFIEGAVELEMTGGGFVKADPRSMQSSVHGLFVGGDVAFGARTAIEAVADGRRAARGIHHFLSGQVDEEGHQPKPRLTPLRMHKMPEGYDRVERLEVPVLPVDRRTGVTEVETGYTREEAMKEASRCLQCNKYPMVDEQKCVLCGGCVDICPYGCLKIVAVDRLEEDDRVDQFAQNRHGLGVNQMIPRTDGPEKRWYAMLKDDEKCIRCNLCVERCPVGAMWMGTYEEAGYAGS